MAVMEGAEPSNVQRTRVVVVVRVGLTAAHFARATLHLAAQNGHADCAASTNPIRMVRRLFAV
jgi:hypothetical protein